MVESHSVNYRQDYKASNAVLKMVLMHYVSFSDFEAKVYPWTKHHNHLNAGFLMATVPNMKKYVELLLQEYERAKSHSEKLGVPLEFDDQGALRRLHLWHYPNIIADTLTKLVSKKDNYVNDL